MAMLQGSVNRFRLAFSNRLGRLLYHLRHVFRLVGSPRSTKIRVQGNPRRLQKLASQAPAC